MCHKDLKREISSVWWGSAEAKSASATLTGKDDNRDPPEAAVTGGENSRKINGRCMSRLGLKRDTREAEGQAGRTLWGLTAPHYSQIQDPSGKQAEVWIWKASGGVNLNLLTHWKQNVIQKAAWAQFFYIFSNQTTYKEKEKKVCACRKFQINFTKRVVCLYH